MVTIARSSQTLEQCISHAINNLADASECVQPFSTEQRQIDAAVRLLEEIDCHAESVIAA